MKAYTDLEQSKKLAEILPIESADMCFVNDGTSIKIDANPYTIRYSMWKDYVVEVIPCWSLAALLDIIPYPTLGKHANETWSCASWVEKVNPYFVKGCDSPINACYEMILKLHEQKIL